MQPIRYQLVCLKFLWPLMMYTLLFKTVTPLHAFVYSRPLLEIKSSIEKDRQPEEPCIPSGDETSIQNALTGFGSVAVLCPGAVFQLNESIYFTHDSQEIYTEGFPTDSTRALLRVAHSDVATAVFAGNNSNVKLRNVIVDGNRPELGTASGALLEFGSAGTGNTVEWVKAYEPRGWSILYMGEGDDLLCSGAVARYNEFGPAGHAEYAMADGISLACRNSIVENNTVFDVTDGGIVIFQATGSVVAGNTIRAENRVMFYGISMEDYGPFDGDFTGTQVTGNTIDASGAMIRRGIGMGPHVGCIPDEEATLRSRGAVVTGNTLMGDHMGYGFVVSGVEDWTVTGNIDSSTHLVPDREQDCFGEVVDPPGGFQLNPLTSSGTFQEEFEAAVLGFTNFWWPADPVASEECLEDLIGADVLEEIRNGLRGPVMQALENAPNGERIGQCISIYQPPDVTDSSGYVVVDVHPLEPFAAEVSLFNIHETETAYMGNAEFNLEMFIVPCLGLPDSIGPGEEVRCVVDDYVAEGFQVIQWAGFPPGRGGMGFTYPSGTSIGHREKAEYPVTGTSFLFQNHPNPCNPSTTIEYIVPEGEMVQVHLDVYNLRGRLIRTLVVEDKEPGRYMVHWDGRDDSGNAVSSGVYLYRLEAGDFTLVRKMTVLR